MASASARPMAVSGPQNIEEFVRWPANLVGKVFCRNDGNDQVRLARFKALVASGLSVYSDYSGMAGEYEFLFQLNEALSSKVVFDIDHRRFCDISKVSQAILSNISEIEFGEPCVMCDINSRLPQHAVSWLDAAMPSQGDNLEAAAASYGSMQTYLMENRQTIFRHAEKDWCVVHRKLCSLFPPSQRSQSDGDNPSQPLVMNFAGTTCRGWSSAGKGRHFSDPSERPHSIWITERRYRAEELLEDMFISECTPRYPVQARGY